LTQRGNVSFGASRLPRSRWRLWPRLPGRKAFPLRGDSFEIPITLRLAVRNVARQRVRTLLTLFAIVLGVMGLILAGGFIEDVFVQMGEATIHSQLGHLQIYRKGYRQYGLQRPLAYLIDDPPSIVRDATELADPQDILLRLNFPALLSNGKTDL